MKQALPPLSARSLWANSRAAFPVHLTGAFRCGFHMDAIAVYRDLVVVTGTDSRRAVKFLHPFVPFCPLDFLHRGLCYWIFLGGERGS